MVEILGIVTLEGQRMSGGGAPVLYCKTKEQQDKAVMDLCRFTRSTGHRIGETVFIVNRG